MGIFLDATQNAGPRYFTLPEFNPSANKNTDEGSIRLSALAGLARQRNTGSDESLDSLTERSLEQIQNGDEEGLRNQIDDIASINEAKRIRETQLEFIRGQIPGATGDDLKALMNMEQGLLARDRPSNNFALEREGISHAQELGSTHPEQEAFFSDPGKIDVLNSVRDHAVKMSIFADRLDKLNKERDTQSGFETFFDVSNIFTPLQMLFDLYGKLDKPRGSNTVELPGTRIQKLSNDLWGTKTPEEFATKLDELIEKLRQVGPDNPADAKNRTAVINLLSEIYAPNDNSKLGVNAFAALDVATTIPLVTILKVARNPAQLLNAIGNRSGAVNLVTETLLKETKGADPGKVMDGVTAVEEALPTYAGPLKSSKIGASLSGEVNRKLAKTQAIVDEVEVIRQRRLEPEQEKAAIAQAVADAEKTFGKDRILDMSQEFDPKTGLWLNHIDLGDEYGLPFWSKEAALESGKARGLVGQAVEAPGWKVVNDEVPEVYGGVRIEETADLSISRKPGDATADVSDDVARFEGEGGSVGDQTTYIDEVSAPGITVRDEVSDYIKAEPMQNAGPGWSLRVTRHVREDGVLPPSIPIKDWGGGKYTEKLRNPAHFLPGLIHSDRVLADTRHSRLAAKVIKPMLNKITKAGHEGLDVISRLYKKNQINESWYDEATFDAAFLQESGRQATAAEKESYYTGILLNDLEYQMRNDWLYEQKAARGTQTFWFDDLGKVDEDTVAKSAVRNGIEVVEAASHWNDQVIYDVENKIRTTPGNNTKRYQERWETGNYRLVKLEESIRTPTGERAKFVFVHKQSSKAGPLVKQQLQYSHAPHRAYADRFYGKQALVEHLDDGTDILHNPITHVVGNEVQVKAWAKKMEKAREAWNLVDDKVNPAPGYRKVIDDLYPGGYNKFKEHVEAGKINPETPFEVTADGAMPAYQARFGAKHVVDWRDIDQSDFEQHAITHKQMYYSEKGEHLRGVDGNLAETLDPYETMSQAVNNVLYLKSYAAYNDKVVKEWVRSAEASKALLGHYKSPWDAFLNGVLDEATLRSTEESRALYRGLTAARDNIKRRMKFSTPGDMKLNKTRANMATFVADKGPKWGKNGKKIGDQVATHLLKTDGNNPVNFLQRMTYMSAFFADLSQLYIQGFTAIAATTIHPIHGLKSWAMAPFSTLAYFNRAPNFIDYVAKAAKAAGVIEDVADYKAMIKTLQKSGWLNIGQEQAEMGMFEHGFIRSLAGRGMKEVERYGTSLMRTAEGVNRMIGFQIAWRDARKAFPNVSPDDPAFLRYLTQKADDMTWNMTRASQRAWQQGLAGVPTRFWSYNMSMMENMLPKQVFGAKPGNPRLTGAQRARLVIGQYLLFGAAGVPAGFLLSEGIETAHKAMTGQPLDTEQKRLAMRGFYDTLLYGATGANIDTASRVGVGQAIEQLMASVAGGTFDKSALELAVGPAGRVGNSMLETIGSVLHYFRYEQVEPLGKDDFWFGFQQLGNTFSAFNRYEAAYWAWKSGSLLDKKTHDVIVGVNDQEKFWLVLGIQPIEVRERFDGILDDNQKDQMAYKMAQQIVLLRNQAFQALEDGDDKTAEALFRKSGAYTLPIREKDPAMFDQILQITTELEKQPGTKYEQIIQRLYTKWGTPLPINEDK